MVHDSIFTNMKIGINAAGTDICCAINKAVDPGIHNGPCTHRTWLYGNIKGTFRQTPAIQTECAAAEDEELGMCGGIMVCFPAIMSKRKDGIAIDQDGTDGDFPSFSAFGLQGEPCAYILYLS